MDKIYDVAASFNLPLVWTFSLIVIGNLVALTLAQIFFPFWLKQKTWKWEKMQKAEGDLLESISRIAFIASSYIEAEHTDRFSFAGLSLIETEKELSDILQKLHENGHQIRPFLEKKKQKLFDKFIYQSSRVYEEAKSSYGHWDQNDPFAEQQHSENLIAELAKVAGKILPSLT